MEQKEMTATLLKLIWRGVPADYKSKYRMTIWDQYENEIRSAAYTSDLGKFVSRLCSRLNASIGKTEAERGAANELLQSLDNKVTLKLLREQTTLLVLMVRVDNQEKQDEWKALHQEDN